MDCKRTSAADRVRDWGEGVQWPKDKKPIFFIAVSSMCPEPIRKISRSPSVRVSRERCGWLAWRLNPCSGKRELFVRTNYRVENRPRPGPQSAPSSDPEFTEPITVPCSLTSVSSLWLPRENKPKIPEFDPTTDCTTTTDTGDGGNAGFQSFTFRMKGREFAMDSSSGFIREICASTASFRFTGCCGMDFGRLQSEGSSHARDLHS